VGEEQSTKQEMRRRPDEHDVLEKVGKFRDRFSLMGSALAIVAILAAVWVRAPTLEIELPLGAEAKVSLNVGYVLAFGIPGIAVAYAWAIGYLVSMRRYQFEILQRYRGHLSCDQELLMLQLGAASRTPQYYDWLDRLAAITNTFARGLILFAIPGVACLFIAIAYFSMLEVYPERHLDPCNAQSRAAECRRDVTPVEHFRGLSSSHEDDRYAIANGDIERACEKEWAAEDGNPKADDAKLANESSRVKCVYDEFPRFVLPLTSWINAVFTVVSIGLAVFGARAFWWLPRAIHHTVQHPAQTPPVKNTEPSRPTLSQGRSVPGEPPSMD
jgi:hypothetical protein